MKCKMQDLTPFRLFAFRLQNARPDPIPFVTPFRLIAMPDNNELNKHKAQAMIL